MAKETKYISPANLAVFCEQTAMLLHSGVLLYEGIRMMAEDAPPGPIQSALRKTGDCLSDNQPFPDALASAQAFPPYLIHMAAIGTESGGLEEIMVSLAAYYRREHHLRETLKSAILYPAVLIAMMGAVLILISVKVLPVFQRVLQGLGTELSPVAAAVMKAGSFFSRFSAAFMLLAVLLACLILFFSLTQKGRAVFARLLANTRTGELMSQAALSSSLAVLLAGGASPDRAIQLSLPVLGNKKIIERTALCFRLVSQEHLSFMEAVSQAGLFPGITRSILSTGTRSGSLDKAMYYVADLYEESFETSVTKKLSLIEPVSVAVLSLLIGAVLISVMLPLLSVMSSIGA